MKQYFFFYSFCVVKTISSTWEWIWISVICLSPFINVSLWHLKARSAKYTLCHIFFSSFFQVFAVKIYLLWFLVDLLKRCVMFSIRLIFNEEHEELFEAVCWSLGVWHSAPININKLELFPTPLFSHLMDFALCYMDHNLDLTPWEIFE